MNFWILKKLILLALILFVFSFSETNAALIYVNSTATGLNNGTSWGDAYTDLQSALHSANPGDNIWTAVGTYYPTHNSDRDSTFDFKDQVNLLGGFVGTETSSSQRNANNHTILPVILEILSVQRIIANTSVGSAIQM